MPDDESMIERGRTASPWIILNAGADGVEIRGYRSANERMIACVRDEIARRVAAGRPRDAVVAEIRGELDHVFRNG